MLSLTVEKRTGAEKVENLRKAGKLPAVYYGPKEKSTSVAIATVEFKKVWKKAGESSVIVLKDGTAEHEVLIHDIDVHPLTGEPRHADFYVIEKGKKVSVKVPIEYHGVAPAVKDLGGILVKVMREIEVEAAPKDLPHDIKVDISKLVQLTDVIAIKDLSVPHGVEFKTAHADDVVASIAEAKEEVEEAPAAIDVSSIEVEAKGKEVKEGEAPAAEAAAPAKAPAKESK